MANLRTIIHYMNEATELWQPRDIVKITLTDERSSGYKTYYHCRIKGENNGELYIKHNAEEIGHYWVWQTVGMLGDDYSGYMLIPLRNNEYLKVSYAC